MSLNQQKKLQFLYVKLKPTWGYAVRAQPQSKMRTAFLHPPPSTLICALSYPYMRVVGDRREILIKAGKPLSSAEKIKAKIAHVAVSTTGVKPIMYGSYLRINRFYRGTIDKAVTVLPTVMTYSQNEDVIEVVYLAENIDDVIERSAWGITRIGSRESVVSTEKVVRGQAIIQRVREAATRFSFYNRSGLKIIQGTADVLRLVDWKTSELGSYQKAVWKTMVYPREIIRVASQQGFQIYRINIGGREEVIVA